MIFKIFRGPGSAGSWQKEPSRMEGLTKTIAILGAMMDVGGGSVVVLGPVRSDQM